MTYARENSYLPSRITSGSGIGARASVGFMASEDLEARDERIEDLEELQRRGMRYLFTPLRDREQQPVRAASKLRTMRTITTCQIPFVVQLV